MNPETVSKIFAKCAAQWGISIDLVEQEYAKPLFTITQITPLKYSVDHQTRPDLIIIIEDEG